MTQLEDKQRAMKERQRRQPRTGRPRRQSQPPEFDQEGFRHMIAAFSLLMAGHSESQVAARLNLNVDAVKEWRELNCPLLLSDLQRNS